MIDLTTKMRALTLLGKHLNRLLRDIGIETWKGVANGDHVFIVDGNLYRVDLNTGKVSKV